jgi:hypothetical protein
MGNKLETSLEDTIMYQAYFRTGKFQDNANQLNSMTLENKAS